ncbi:MAG: tetratricopeptide repeat protein [Planctomycetota bacterium]|nr:tetratricopeptide repeat protein [Planctomycetota bacterium]
MAPNPSAAFVLHRALPLALVALAFAGPGAHPTAAATAPASLSQDDLDAELEALLAEERAEAARLLRRGEYSQALAILDLHLEDEPDDWRSRGLVGRAHLDRARYDEALEQLTRAVATGRAAAEPGSAEDLTDLGLDLASLELELGRTEAALARLAALPSDSARRGHLLGDTLFAAGRQLEAREAWGSVVFEDGRRYGWRELYHRAACERALGQLEAASASLVTADRLARLEGSSEPDVLVALGDVYLEADGEVAKAGTSSRRPALLYREALELHESHPGALLGLYRLHDLNFYRSSQSARSFLDQLLEQHPGHVPAMVTLVADRLGNSELRWARAGLAELERRAPGRRDVRSLAMILAYLGDDLDAATEQLGALIDEAPWDSSPERLLGETLLDLYRFADALPFLESAVERAPGDYRAWTRLGEALSNTGDEAAGLAALQRAKDAAEGRQDAWRHNETLVLSRMAKSFVEIEGDGQLTFALPPEGTEVLARVLEPFYVASREELSARYGFTPGPVRVEVFDRHRDFSVRSTGFEGFPALGVCFGDVVTALSPLCELRGTFSWAETSFHEFSHVIHLGLTRNRCPRWITEGLATWEEQQKNPSWTRNLRRELVDSVAGGQIIGVRDLNRAFRGPRIIWAYYQGKLMCDLLIADYGFPAVVDLLAAFNAGLDLDDALEAAFDLTPEELDAAFLAHCEGRVAELFVEPRHDLGRVRLMSLSLSRKVPEDSAAAAAWAEDWTTVAWSAWQGRKRIDAEEALRRIGDLAPPRASFLRAELALAAGDREEAALRYRAGFAAGGEDYAARMALGSLLLAEGENDAAEEQFLAAEQAFPGWDDPNFSAERSLAALYESTDREDLAMAAWERWLGWNSGDFGHRLKVGEWRLERGEAEAALALFTGAIEVDPFSTRAHRGQGEALLALGRADEAIYAFETALVVPPELDIDLGAGFGAPVPAERIEAMGDELERRRAKLEELIEQARGA